MDEATKKALQKAGKDKSQPKEIGKAELQGTLEPGQVPENIPENIVENVQADNVPKIDTKDKFPFEVVLGENKKVAFRPWTGKTKAF